IHARLGTIAFDTENESAALKEYKQAGALYARLAGAHPDRREDRGKLADLHVRRGLVYNRMARLPDPEAEFRAAPAGFAKLRKDDPHNVEHRRQLAEAHHSLGEIYHYLAGDLGQALMEFEDAREIRERLDRRDPRNRRDLARSHGYIGDVQLEIGFWG